MQVYEKFWRRELDLEDMAAMSAELSAVGINGKGLAQYATEQGYAELEAVQERAEAQGVFGVPSYRIDGQLYWGGERLERVREHLESHSD